MGYRLPKGLTKEQYLRHIASIATSKKTREKALRLLADCEAKPLKVDPD